MLQRWFAYQNEAKSMWKRLPDLDFWYLVWNFFYTHSNMKKKKSNFWDFSWIFQNKSPSYRKTKTKNEKSRSGIFFSRLLSKFWYVNHLCSIKTGRVLLFWTKKKAQKTKNLRKEHSKFSKVVPMHAYNFIML